VDTLFQLIVLPGQLKWLQIVQSTNSLLRCSPDLLVVWPGGISTAHVNLTSSPVCTEMVELCAGIQC